ncbi:MAG: hypothetical protein Q7V57_11125 [Actinomycetota bacterium]|nr:hypothetical protein [Actinomycetota bacterium]
MDDVTTAHSMTLLPPAADKCQECAVDHPADWPHNPDSLFYKVKFNIDHGRVPTWRDAWAHCTPEVRRSWFDLLQPKLADLGMQPLPADELLDPDVVQSGGGR